MSTYPLTAIYTSFGETDSLFEYTIHTKIITPDNFNYLSITILTTFKDRTSTYASYRVALSTSTNISQYGWKTIPAYGCVINSMLLARTMYTQIHNIWQQTTLGQCDIYTSRIKAGTGMEDLLYRLWLKGPYTSEVLSSGSKYSNIVVSGLTSYAYDTYMLSANLYREVSMKSITIGISTSTTSVSYG